MNSLPKPCRSPARGLDAVELLPRAVDRGIVFVPGAAFDADAADVCTLRLSFVTASVEQIDAGITVLAAILRENLARTTPC
ncbi:hypothetical protein WMF41_05305 [Sorangium sp. So ce1151]